MYTKLDLLEELPIYTCSRLTKDFNDLAQDTDNKKFDYINSEQRGNI